MISNLSTSLTTDQDKNNDTTSQQIQRAIEETTMFGGIVSNTLAIQNATNKDFADAVNSNLKSIGQAQQQNLTNSELSNTYTRLLNAITESNKVQAVPGPKEVKSEQPTQTANMDQSKLYDVLTKQLDSMQEHMTKTDNLISLMSENKDYTRSLLQNSY